MTNDRVSIQRFPALLGIWPLVIGYLLLASARLAAEDPRVAATKITAEYVRSTVNFVSWPEAAFTSPNQAFVVAVLGEDPFLGPALEHSLGKETVHGRKVRIQHVKDLGQLIPCQVLFICRSEWKQFPRILKELAGKPILTVSELSEFCQAGGMVKLVKSEGKLRFEINTEAAKAADLEISSQLLKLAEITPSPEPVP